MSHRALLTLLLGLLAAGARPWCLYGSFTHSNDIFDASWSPDGNMIVVGGKDNKQWVYDSKSFAVVYNPTGSPQCNSARFSPNQQYIAYGMQNSSVLIVDVSGFSINTAIPTAFAVVNEVHFSTGSDKLLVCGGPGPGTRGY
jgi:WD40 repeat protein